MPKPCILTELLQKSYQRTSPWINKRKVLGLESKSFLLTLQEANSNSTETWLRAGEAPRAAAQPRGWSREMESCSEGVQFSVTPFRSLKKRKQSPHLFSGILKRRVFVLWTVSQTSFHGTSCPYVAWYIFIVHPLFFPPTNYNHVESNDCVFFCCSYRA